MPSEIGLEHPQKQSQVNYHVQETEAINKPDNEKWLTVDQASKLAGVSKSAIRGYISNARKPIKTEMNQYPDVEIKAGGCMFLVSGHGRNTKFKLIQDNHQNDPIAQQNSALAQTKLF